jgi:glucokinase
MSIERLSLIDTITASTNFAVNVNGQDYRALAGTVADYVQATGVTGDGKVIQYAGPTSTGFTVNITNSSASVWLVLTPNATMATGTIVLPDVANCVESQEILVSSSQTVTALTINLNGALGVGTPTTISSGGFFTLRFEPILKTWYRVG